MGRPVAVVTGAARGIGLEAARRRHRTHRVAPLDIDGEVAFFSWIDTDMVRGAEERHQAFAELRADLRAAPPAALCR